MSDHEEVIDQIYRSYLQNLRNSDWDEVHKEVFYYYDPEDGPDDLIGQKKGELDIMLVDKEKKRLKYIEVKTRAKDLDYAEEQIERAKSHWEDNGWTVEGDTIVA